MSRGDLMRKSLDGVSSEFSELSNILTEGTMLRLFPRLAYP
jgi:hypothetical protein